MDILGRIELTGAARCQTWYEAMDAGHVILSIWWLRASTIIISKNSKKSFTQGQFFTARQVAGKLSTNSAVLSAISTVAM